MPCPPDAIVLRSVPHRAPILRVHRVVQVDPTSARVDGREPDGPGALPWAVGAIEGLAQTAAVMLANAMAASLDGRPLEGMLVAVKRFEITGEPPPGAEISYHVRLTRRLGPTALVTGHAECDGVRLASGELTVWVARPAKA